MSDSQAPPLPFGTALAFAERALTASLKAFLAERDVTPHTWYALNVTARRGPLPVDALRSDLEQARDASPASVRELLDRLASDGLIDLGSGEATLTADGEALYRSLRDAIAARTARLLEPFDPSEVEATIRVLRTLAERAEVPREE
jgi:DNA-binding MarR family transcriptional regulator